MKTKEQRMRLAKLTQQALNWAGQLYEGGFIEGPGSYRTHLILGGVSVSQDELDSVTKTLIHIFGRGSFGNSMGEIIPGAIP